MNSKSSITLHPFGTISTFLVPYLQRGYDEQHVQDMVIDQQKEFEKYGCFSMLQSITVGVHENSVYVLDGQHRIKAYQRLGALGFPVQNVILPVVAYQIQSFEELVDYFTRINKNKPIHPFEMQNAWLDYGKEFCKKFCETFSAYTKGKGASRCPNISIEALKTHLAGRNIDQVMREKRLTLDQLWNKILEVNMAIKTHIPQDETIRKKIVSCEAKALFPCYLSILRNFEWIDIALYNTDIKLTISSISKKRMTIPALIRQQVWKKHNKNICDEGECFVCENKLNFSDMECGHIIAHALGGSDSNENLMPVCRTCNRDMGIMNLYEYKRMFSDVNMMT